MAPPSPLRLACGGFLVNNVGEAELMRIVYIVPGSGGRFYCQNCLRDTALVKRLQQDGHDAIVVPLYLPLVDDDGRALSHGAPVFYGAISLYLRQQIALLRRLPLSLTRLFDAGPMLAMAARRAGSTRASGLEQLTESMLLGHDGNQSAELEQLVTWLADGPPVDVVHLSNGLLLGLAARLKSELGSVVVCSLQDEDQWVDPMRPRWRKRIWRLMAERATEVDLFVASSRFYAERMADVLGLADDRIRTVYPGIEVDAYSAADAAPSPPVLGYMSRMADSLGLGDLVDAFIDLRSEPGLEALRLRIAGGSTDDDEDFLRSITDRLRRNELTDAVDFVPGLDRADRAQFLRSLTALSVPVPAGEAFGTFQIEAMASAVPVVQPAVGAFPEIVHATGGGLVYEVGPPGALQDALRAVLTDPDYARTLGRRGRLAVHEHFTIVRMAHEIVSAYRSCS